MPGGDRSGPMGAGPMTGRRAGYCAGYTAPGFSNPAPAWYGAGYKFWGSGRGWRNMYYRTGLPGWQRYGYAAPLPQDESAVLKQQAELLKDQLDAINQRLEELK